MNAEIQKSAFRGLFGETNQISLIALKILLPLFEFKADAFSEILENDFMYDRFILF